MDVDQRLYRSLNTVPSLHQDLKVLVKLGPAAPSPAIDDAVATYGDLIAIHALTAIVNAMDHLLAWSCLYRDAAMVPVFAHMTLLRAAVEGSSRARWLVDPTVTRDVRIARGIAALLNDLREQRRIEAIPDPADAPPRPAGATADERIKQWTERTDEAGIVPTWLNRTETAAQFGPGEFWYRVLCQFAHGGHQVVIGASAWAVDDAPSKEGVSRLRMEADTRTVWLLTAEVVKGALVAVAELYDYHGHLPPAVDGSAPLRP